MELAMSARISPLDTENDIKPYRIHVSSKYLDLTRKKLELTRLPHETSSTENTGSDNSTRKAEIEPLIDYWSETYSWRIEESRLNQLPQYRTAFEVPQSRKVPLRIHFVHQRSSNVAAIPLLLIPTFPLTNLSIAPLFSALARPSDPTTQAFHLVVPNIPGLGFSDAFDNNEKPLKETANLFNQLMERLGYGVYLASSTGSGRKSPNGIDYHLAHLLAVKFPDHCLGVHLVDPPFAQPSLAKEPWLWTKYKVARFFHAPVWGYNKDDWLALKSNEKSSQHKSILSRHKKPGPGAAVVVGLREPNTFAYALCDSPVGLLSLVCSALRRQNPQHSFSDKEIIDITQLAWLPGPEAAMRLWSGAMPEVCELNERCARSTAALTIVGSGGNDYVCPAWGSARHRIIWSQRVSGNVGLLAWDRSDVISAGIRGLAKEVLERDGRLKAKPLEVVVVPRDEDMLAADEETSLAELSPESPDTVVAVDLHS